MKTADELLMMGTHRRVLLIAVMQGWVMYSPGSNGQKWANSLTEAGLLKYEGIVIMSGVKIFVSPDAMVYRPTVSGRTWVDENECN